MSEPQTMAVGIKAALAIIGAVVFLIGVIYGFHKYVDYMVDKKIHDDKLIKEIANSLRPFVVFNENGSVLYDEGAMKFIENIEVVPGGLGQEPKKIIISPKEPFKRDPIFQCLNDRFQTIESRGKRFDYIYELKSIEAIVTQASGEITSWQFKLEILR